jgi:2-oxoglutarate dehydrogenase E1 component
VTEFKSGGDHQFLRVGDVKYHLGTRGTLFFGDKSVQISLSPNPSHLEAVDPVVLGKTRAKQFFKQDHSRQQNMGLLLHGDAAFSGLGLAAEVMQVYFV